MTTAQFNIQQIVDMQEPPPLFERGAPMWHDPYISRQMLNFHLNETHDIASRRPAVIDSMVSWMVDQTGLEEGKHLLDLGCGPGLYTRRFADLGLNVTGVDYSQNSIDYATNQDPASRYICQNYVDLDLPDHSFDVVIMIYGDFCVLSTRERDTLLVNIEQMLKPGGYFVFDVTQPQMHQYLDGYNYWSVAADGGFWQAEPYLVLEQGFIYPDNVSMQQYIVISADGSQTTYRNWYRDYTRATLTPILQSAGYNKLAFYGDLTGTPYREPDDWCGVVAATA